MGDVARLEVVADARAADAVDALPVALPRAAQYTGFASMPLGSGRRLLNVGRLAPSATTVRTETEHPLPSGSSAAVVLGTIDSARRRR